MKQKIMKFTPLSRLQSPGINLNKCVGAPKPILLAIIQSPREMTLLSTKFDTRFPLTSNLPFNEVEITKVILAMDKEWNFQSEVIYGRGKYFFLIFSPFATATLEAT